MPNLTAVCHRFVICDRVETLAYVTSFFCDESSAMPYRSNAPGLPYRVSARRIVPLTSVPRAERTPNRPA
jgi:hypothetical protein